MTTNNNTMSNRNQYIQMDPVKKIKVTIGTDLRITYVNDYFVELTGFKIHELVLQGFEKILHPDMPKFYIDMFKERIEKEDLVYFIFKGLIKGGDYYYSFIKITPKINKQNEHTGYLIEGKMLPASAIEKVENMLHILKEIESNAGKEPAFKYFEGHLEERNMQHNEYVLYMAGVDKKTAKKYFELGDKPKKKKKGWF